jgi:nucleoside-diphosphate-sugar epimerase
MKLLILGGTQFVGRAVAGAALAGGHGVTLFHRGRTNPTLFPEAEHVLGDRDRDLSALAGRRFDAVVDTSGYVPRAVRAAVEAVPGAHYVFVSTISVYADFARGPDEASPVRTGDDGYGELKAACERELPDGALVVRPGLIVGPHDPTYRFTYWVERIARGGEVVAPEPRDAHVQMIDARDLGEWLVRSAEARLAGVFNAVGPAAPVTMAQLLETIRGATGSTARLHWVGADVLLAAGVEEWTTLPLWLADPAWRGHGEVDNTRALAAGLRLRPLEQTVRDTLAWTRSGAQTYVDQGRPRPGLDPRLEAELLAGAAA